jgi:hypothetical protein
VIESSGSVGSNRRRVGRGRSRCPYTRRAVLPRRLGVCVCRRGRACWTTLLAGPRACHRGRQLATVYEPVVGGGVGCPSVGDAVGCRAHDTDVATCRVRGKDVAGAWWLRGASHSSGTYTNDHVCTYAAAVFSHRRKVTRHI